MNAGKRGASSANSGTSRSSGASTANAASNTSSPSGKTSSASSNGKAGSASSTSKSSETTSDKVSLSSEAKSKDADTKSSVNLDAWSSDDTSNEVKSSDQAKQEAETSKADAAEARKNADLSASLGSKTLKSGMHDESVRSLQSALNEKLGKELSTDGKFGPKTQEAVKEFQRQNGLEPDGVVGPKTRAALTGGGSASQDTKAAIQNSVTLPDNVPIPRPNPRANQPAAAKPADGKLSFGAKLSDGQKAAVNQMVADLKAKGFEVKADDITNFMAVETGGTFSPSIRSGGAKDGAVGLAQFTGTAIDDMNRLRPKNDQLTRDGLAEMGFDEQSKVVTEYLSTALSRKNMQGKEISGADLYTAVFSPAAIGKPMNSTIYDKSVNRRNYNANRSLDTDKDGKITKAELTSRLTDWANRGAELRG